MFVFVAHEIIPPAYPLFVAVILAVLTQPLIDADLDGLAYPAIPPAYPLFLVVDTLPENEQFSIVPPFKLATIPPT